MSKKDQSTATAPAPLKPERLRWVCDPTEFEFTSTAEIEPVRGVIGQDDAMEALQFGLECIAQGQNVYVKGLVGTGRMTLLGRLLKEIRPSCPRSQDRCFVHNFRDPSRPCLITLPRGEGRRFEHMVHEFAEFIRNDLAEALGGGTMKQRMAAAREAAERRIKEATQPLEEEAEAKGIALVTIAAGSVVRPAIIPKVDGKPVQPEQYESMHQQGEVADEAYQEFHEKRASFDDKLEELNDQVQKIVREHIESAQRLAREEAEKILHVFVRQITHKFPQPEVLEFIEYVVRDVVEERLASLDDDSDNFTRRYLVNVILSHELDEECPTIIEHAPTHGNLIGTIDRVMLENEVRPADHMSIRGGAILQADGGFLVLDARDVLTEPGAWKALVRTLRTGQLEITTIEDLVLGRVNFIKPEPIPINLKVILIGDHGMYYLLDHYDPDFPQLFKVLAEFDNVVPNTSESRAQYARVIARLVEEDDLIPFRSDAVAAIVEHGCRVASDQKRLTTRFSRIADIARESAFIARKREAAHVEANDVRETVRRTKRRADLTSRRFREYIKEGVIQLQTSGVQIGQINGLAVSQSGPLTYGFPARITATIGPGSDGLVNIERESELSGSIHTKGMYILEGLLRFLLPTTFPLTFNASIAFEQSYGGIDGDSASCAEICCLLSALTSIPLRQDLAITGAIDQRGSVMAIGGVNEKIEGFFDVCRDVGMTGTQGVIIPHSNVDDLMLRSDVVESVRQNQFPIFAVRTVHEALAILSGEKVGRPDDDGVYPKKTLLRRAVDQAEIYWKQVSHSKID